VNRRWHLGLLISVVAVSQRPTRAPGQPDGGSTVTVTHPVAAAVAAGRHERLETPHGAVHVWVPAGYHADGAALVAYVHGYYDDVDSAWSGHRLAEQFALSGVNAVFVACEAPKGLRAPVEWRSLGELIETVERAGIERPLGPVVAIGHSGAYRTMIGWLEEPSLDLVISLDAMYAETEPFRDWVRAAPRHRFVDVTEDTVRWSEELARDLASVNLDRVPPDSWPKEALAAKALFVRSQHAHMPIVTGGRVIPLVLRLVPAETLPDAPWALLPGDLPPAAKAR
jgi:hypothetical protein